MHVSVAMCTYNGAAYLQEQLESIASQTRPPDELVVCDDRSEDATARIVEAFARTAPFPVRWHVNPANLGITRNFEQAIALCQGDVIFLSDQDDVWRPGKVRRIEEVLAADESIGLVFSNGQVVDDQLRPLGYQLWDSLWFGELEQRRVRRGDATGVFLRHTVAAGGTLAFRARYRDLLLPIPDLRSAHDAWTALLIAAVTGVAIVDEPLIQYRLHSDNQIGLRKWNLRGQVTQARQQIRTRAFRYGLDLHQAAYERLTNGTSAKYRVEHQVLDHFQEKIRHCRVRDTMPQQLLARLPFILRESLTLRYFRYSYGWKSIGQDLLLR